MIRQADEISLFTKFSQSCNLASHAYVQCLNTILGSITVYIPIDIWLDFGEIITRLFSGYIFQKP